MNHEGIVISIRQMTAAIKTARLQGQVNPVRTRPDQRGVELDRLQTRILQWETQIANWRREIKSRDHRNDMIFNASRHGPGSYSARQSHTDRAKALRKLDLALAEALDELRGLVGDLCRGMGPEQAGMEAMGHAAENIIKMYNGKIVLDDIALQRDGEAVMKAVRQLVPPGDVAPPTGIGVDLFVLVLGYLAVLRALGKRRGQ